jgi:hypothetical protein
MRPEPLEGSLRDDRILQGTRIVAGLIIPFLLAASAILLFAGESMGQRFAWDIGPAVTAAYAGGGYLGGAYFFARVLTGREWRRVAAGFLPVTAFAISMFVATLLEWETFDPGHFPFQVWLVLYIVTPVLVPWLWWRNRRSDPLTVEAHDVVVPLMIRRIMGLFGAAVVLLAVVSFITPGWLIEIWPWRLSTLTARFLAGWHMLLGVGGLTLARESRWAGWRTGAQSIILWQLVALAGMVVHQGDFHRGAILNGYTLFVVSAVLAVGALYTTMETRSAGSALTNAEPS